MPTPFRADEAVRIVPDLHGIGVALKVRDHFDIIKSGEYKVFAVFQLAKSEPLPEINHAGLGMGVDSLITFFLAELESGMHKFESGT